VIYIFQKIHEKVPSKLLMIGDGPERPNAERLCRELDICQDVRFLGKQDAIEELLAICDLFVIPSENESFGLAALEAMACEVPVISSNSGGLPEVNIQGQTGFLSEPGNIEEMAANSIRLLQDDALLQQFRQNALEQARRFDIHRILPLYEQYYEEVLANSVIKVE
jgi:N-acetyl-alpha-D-glucosaminyl L-malate synthase BshA